MTEQELYKKAFLAITCGERNIIKKRKHYFVHKDNRKKNKNGMCMCVGDVTIMQYNMLCSISDLSDKAFDGFL